MKYLFTLFLLALTVLSGCSADHSGTGAGASDAAGSPLRVGLVFDVGGRGDKAFNDLAYNGLAEAKNQLGVDFVYVEPGGEGGDREAALRQMAADPDVRLVIGVGLLFSEDITRIAAEFPDKHFACVDYLPQAGAVIPSNLSGMVFEEKKGSFLAGALAALTTKTGIVGFIGGMDSAIIRKFEDGFRRGVHFVNPDLEVISGFIGMTGSAFANPAKGRELALGQYGRGADIIYQAAGASGLGVMEAARETGRLVICTDCSEETLQEPMVLGSMTKAVDRAVFSLVADLQKGSFDGGRAVAYGLADRYTGMAYGEDSKQRIPAAVFRRLEALRTEILSGNIALDETAALP
ncbi:BMP family ABC transporter substrate-binding protein [Chlorobium sp. N1]|uniref:BMP family lipoprotein n=1 Tax=Chlorobium sp. N1 TaxID=2491138 RepID=UPI0010409326|nr:BMP family ABC transporter substrate-binding protein [Chlorobium sp. N1]TCD48334.1 BMP family ABC transporter substrate-binding protein [Chlorobium sp. N1]